MLNNLRTQRVGHRLTKTLVFIAVLLTLSQAASGHAKLVQSQPKANETLITFPRVIELWFSEPLETGLNTIEVTDEAGKRMDSGEVALAEENKKAIVNLLQLNPGRYTVRWKALSADQHPMRGTFNFTIAESANATATSSPAQTAASPVTMPHAEMPVSTSGESISWKQTLVRWLSYLGMMLLFGSFTFRQLVLIPALRSGGGMETSQLLFVGSKRIVASAWIGAILLLVTSILALLLQASDVFDISFVAAWSPDRLAEVLRTGYGPSWLLQVGSLLALIVILLMLSRATKRNRGKGSYVLWWAGLLAAALLLVAPTWTGHARLSVEHFRLALITDWLHLVAGGFWVGSLFHFALTLKPILSAAAQRQRIPTLHNLIRSFTRVAIPSVVLLVLAGSYNTWAHVPRLSALWLTPYGKTLSLKLLVVLLMLFLGALNNYHFGKRATRLAEKEHPNSDSGVQLGRSFFRSLRFEAALGVIVLLITAALVFFTPARNHPAMDQGEATAERK